MVLRAAMLGDDVHLRAASETILGRVGAHLNVDLGNRVDVGRAAEITASAAAPAAVAAVDAVNVQRLCTTAGRLNGWDASGKAPSESFLIVGLQLHAGQHFEK